MLHAALPRRPPMSLVPLHLLRTLALTALLITSIAWYMSTQALKHCLLAPLSSEFPWDCIAAFGGVCTRLNTESATPSVSAAHILLFYAFSGLNVICSCVVLWSLSMCSCLVHVSFQNSPLWSCGLVFVPINVLVLCDCSDEGWGPFLFAEFE